MIEWKVVRTEDVLDQIQEDSFLSPQMIFKHSTTCPISSMARNRVESDWNLTEVTPYFLDLLAHRSISNAIAAKWGVEHQSPQLILIKDGKAIFDESHLDINLSAVRGLLSRSNA